MRKIFIFACMVLFIANTTLVSAWVKPCMQDTTISALNTNMAPQHDEPPCHQIENIKSSKHDNQSCDRLCLCDHVSNNPLVLLKKSQGIALLVTSKQPFVVGHDALASVNQPPPKRPPKIIS